MRYKTRRGLIKNMQNRREKLRYERHLEMTFLEINKELDKMKHALDEYLRKEPVPCVYRDNLAQYVVFHAIGVLFCYLVFCAFAGNFTTFAHVLIMMPVVGPVMYFLDRMLK